MNELIAAIKPPEVKPWVRRVVEAAEGVEALRDGHFVASPREQGRGAACQHHLLDRIGHKATAPRSKIRNTARVQQTPSKQRGKAFPTG
jgi:hypothetical protein